MIDNEKKQHKKYKDQRRSDERIKPHHPSGDQRSQNSYDDIVTSVEVAPDLKTCKAYISVMGSDEEKKDTIAGLRSAEGYVRRQLAKRLNLRNTPEIQFVLDQSIEYGVHMSRLIDEVNKETPERDEEDDK